MHELDDLITMFSVGKTEYGHDGPSLLSPISLVMSLFAYTIAEKSMTQSTKEHQAYTEFCPSKQLNVWIQTNLEDA